MALDTSKDELRLMELQKAELEKGYTYLRWLVLIAAGAFSISFGIIIGDHKPSLTHLYLAKTAITFNALGVLAGVIGVYGEVNIASGIKVAVIDVILEKMADSYAGREASYVLPQWLKWSQRICFVLLALSLSLWIVFIWAI